MCDALPVIRSETTLSDSSVALHLYVPNELDLLTGHFPGFPLLPGVTQIHWAAQLGVTRFAIDGHFSRLLTVKFHKPILPNCDLSLVLNWEAVRRQLAFTFSSTHGCHTSGKIEFAMNSGYDG